MGIDDSGMYSPPPDDGPEVSDKAAKLMGMDSRAKRESTSTRRERSSGKYTVLSIFVFGSRSNSLLPAAPDPYPIDDDDVVMVDGHEDADGLPPREPHKSSKHSRRRRREVSERVSSFESSALSRGYNLAGTMGNANVTLKQSRAKPDDLQDDIAMVDADQLPHDPGVFSGQDDLAFVEPPPKERRVRRSNTTPKKSEGGGLLGLFGSLRRSTKVEPPERRRSRSYRDEEAKPMTDAEREARRARREERRRRSMRAETDVECFATDADPAGEACTEPKDAEARRAERRAKRSSRHAAAAQMAVDAELREAEERRARRREAHEKRAREEEEEREERRREEKRARRAAREERRAREEQEAREAEAREAEALAEAKAAERRERRRTRETEEINGNSRHASRYRRHRSSAAEPIGDGYPPDEYVGERAKRHHRSYRSGEEGGRSRRRKSVAADPDFRPVMSGGRDKTSSWVNSQATDPPEPPPIVPTVVDAPPGAENTHSLSSDEEARRRMRRLAHKRAKYPGLPDEEIDEIRARRRESRRAERAAIKSSSGSGDCERERNGRAYDDRRAQPTGLKRMSWFKKLTSR